ncbi:MAG: DUF4317 domain-containing protein [Muribaculaceae bacterium]|nr:DUF4317 domain-containing protein [Roseburia sp.]MCM1431428.1 DUF4317 domain-containing protein [Muribaculaceae bacterium]MCM1491870.1 DUF4317 domain-containing protein [Muribaculaceae bacterium]
MNKKEVAEIKRRFKKESATFTRVAGCYVDGNHNKVCKIGSTFLNLEEEEFYKYLEIANKALSGTMGNNLLELQFPLEEEEVGGRQQILMALRETKLLDEALLDTYYDLVIDTYDHAGNYLILLFHDNYDVMVKTSDHNRLDESEEVYEYLICAICPVDLSKPGLGYLEEEKRIGPRIRDWIVGAPDTAFLFPAFSDRSTDIHATLFYTKNTKEPHSEFMANGLGCGVERTATEQKLAFHSIVRNVLGAEDESTEEALLDIQQNLSGMLDAYEETHDGEDVFLLDKEAVSRLLTESKIPEEKAQRIEKSVEDAFGDKPPAAEHVIDAKALAQNELRVEKLALEDQVGDLTLQLGQKEDELKERTDQLARKQEEIDNYVAETKTYDVVLRVKPEKAAQIKSRVIDGQKCLVIPMEEDEHAAINGVNTTV